MRLDIELLVRERSRVNKRSLMLTILIEDLTSKKRHLDAARVLLDYAGDVRDAVIALTQGNAFSEARRVVRLYRFLERVSYSIFVGDSSSDA